MAREDLLAQLLRTIVEKEGPPPPDDNTLIQKMILPNDSCSLDDGTVTITILDTKNFIWGGDKESVTFGVAQTSYYQPGWKWGQGQWK